MKVIVFDTETTGLPKHRNIYAKSMENNWPHIVSISWMILENDVPVDSRSYIVKPNGWVIPSESSRIHGISHEQAMQEGKDLQFVIDEFICQHYDLLVAHNLEFDENVLVNAIYWDLNRKNFLQFPHPKRCTMTLSQSICKLPSAYTNWYKPPKLSELYKFVFGNDPIMKNLHSSMYDVEILVKIIQHSAELRSKLGLTERCVLKNNVATAFSKTLSL
jgi:DNA polymerase III epsilon subunit-like protein